MERPFRILLAVDFSRPSVAALEATLALGKRLQAEVTLVHAYRPLTRAPALAATTSKDATAPFVETEQEMQEDEVRTLCEDWTRPLREAGLDVALVTDEGPPDRLILKTVDERHVDIIVMGRQGAGSGTLRRVLMGSVTRSVVERSERPVLLVPLPEKEG